MRRCDRGGRHWLQKESIWNLLKGYQSNWTVGSSLCRLRNDFLLKSDITACLHDNESTAIKWPGRGRVESNEGEESLRSPTTGGGWESKHRQRRWPLIAVWRHLIVEKYVLRKALLSFRRPFQNAYSPPLLAPSAGRSWIIPPRGKSSRKQELYHFHPPCSPGCYNGYYLMSASSQLPHHGSVKYQGRCTTQGL